MNQTNQRHLDAPARKLVMLRRGNDKRTKHAMPGSQLYAKLGGDVGIVCTYCVVDARVFHLEFLLRHVSHNLFLLSIEGHWSYIRSCTILDRCRQGHSAICCRKPYVGRIWSTICSIHLEESSFIL